EKMLEPAFYTGLTRLQCFRLCNNCCCFCFCYHEPDAPPPPKPPPPPLNPPPPPKPPPRPPPRPLPPAKNNWKIVCAKAVKSKKKIPPPISKLMTKPAPLNRPAAVAATAAVDALKPRPTTNEAIMPAIK